MAVLFYHVLISFVLMSPCASRLDLVDPESSQEDSWVYRNAKKIGVEESCSRVRPTARNLIKRVYSIIPFFDKENSNTAFLRKYRATIYDMSERGADLDQEAAYYAAVLTPLIFLQNYKNTWCLLERFHRALHLYQNSHPMDKRSALKLLQNYRSVTKKVKKIIWNLPGASQKSLTTVADMEEEDVADKKDIRYIKEFIKNLG